MLRITLQKLWHKKWINLCLLLGSTLLIATVVSFPLYRTAACDRMLIDEFRNRIAGTGEWIAMNRMTLASQRDAGGKNIRRMEGFMKEVSGRLGVTQKETITHYNLSPAEIRSLMNRVDAEDLTVRLGCLSDLSEHAVMLSGEMFSDEGLTEDGCIEVVISQSAMVEMGLLVGETLEFKGLKDADGQTMRMYVSGVFDMADSGDFYWQVKPEELSNECLMNYELFRQMFTGDNAGKYTVNCNWFPMFEYEDLTAGQVEQLIENTAWMTEESPYRSTVKEPPYSELLDSYLAKKGRIEATLIILQVPVLILLAAFLFMISGQMYETEKNEISVIKSRGSSGGQIFRLYLYQSIFITCAGAVFGIPLGKFFSRILGAASNFLEFDNGRVLEIVFTAEALQYAVGAMAATLMVLAIPAIKHSRLSIVKLKQQKALKKKSLWEKLFLDVILLAVSLYGFYSYSRSTETLTRNVLEGQALDPLLYISSSLFILGTGLLFLRLQPLLVQLIYLIGKRFWKPASYASFVDNLKNGRKQQSIMLFLILTVSLGMYHATVARSILQNARENAEYMDGADIMLKEVWRDTRGSSGYTGGLMYYEPDYSKYASMDFASGYTRVLRDEEATAYTDSANSYTCTLMGIHTREFGENTWVASKLTRKPYYEYLNELALAEDGVLISENLRSILGCKAGDTIHYTDKDGNEASGTIIDFISYWPGYQSSSMELNADGESYVEEHYLVVTHYEALRQKWGTTPYEVWITLKEGNDSQDMYRWLEDNNVRLTSYTDRQADVTDTVEDPLLQGTNGVLTMGFLVTILLCAVGYLIYWIMSIRSREMVFGVLRASGLHKGELFHMLMNEQIFSGVFSILAGIGIGKLASRMFVPIIQLAYMSPRQALPMELVVETADMTRLYSVIAAAMALCFVVLIVLLFKMNVAKALKLGEE